MAASSLLTLIDDIATLLDDVAVTIKVAAKKTSGVLGDDLALNAQQVTGVSADRELPVVCAVTKGSALNRDHAGHGGRGDVRKQVAVLTAIAVAMTIRVYGFVAGIVKLDDAGLWLVARGNGASKAIGRGILIFAPWLMKALSILGTAAMFLVGGGILVHGIPGLEGFVRPLTATAGKAGSLLLKMLADGVVGVFAGGIVLALVSGYRRIQVQSEHKGRKS